MRWFKHYSDSLDDPFIHALMDEFGHLGYAVWFGLIEIIARENGNNITGRLSVSPTYLRRKLRTSQTKLREVFDFCQTNARLSVKYSEKKWDFDFPKIAQIKDNYTKDLQGTGKKPSKHKEVDKDTKEKEVYKKKGNKEKKDKKKTYGEFKNVFLTDQEYKTLETEYPRKGMLEAIEEFSAYMASKGKAYKNHFATLRPWLRKKGVEKFKICTVKTPAPQDEKNWQHPDAKEVTNKSTGIEAKRCIHCKRIIYS